MLGEKMSGFDDQFSLSSEDYLNQLNFVNWIRYYHILKTALAIKPSRVLEIGVGNGIVRDILSRHCSVYHTLDINARLAPDYVRDLSEPDFSDLSDYDLVIVADVLEHIPFDKVKIALKNISRYLRPGGKVIATIPNRRSHFLFMSPTYKPSYFSLPHGFLTLGSFIRRFILKKIWIDPHHCWEISDGSITVKNVESVFADCCFLIENHKRITYVDLWLAKKAGH
ncbi:hypothetical protein OTERR_25570 [Oryzomicrobium terrae]|uniref:Methyltransferase type 11 domain-containing protein n=1 Tax=Oryzomicrobium terrae TaxID=1735038 RepID=A0A5C1EAW1_9RHOO|nr:class I SAM-dependent methyltransferase [Oryzomicrobium terrae]QEL66033.1 hypothetical protein OTERR_25570 [Oryzomicrobium terrae]